MASSWVMAVGGVDPSGGAGLAVDRRAIQVQGLRCVAIATANTDQDDREVRGVGAVSGERWLQEALAHCRDELPCALKFGLLPGPGALAAAAALVDELLARNPDLPVVLDPVLASSSGFEFLSAADFPALMDLCRRPLILTPNRPELEALVSGPVDSEERRLAAARELLDLGLRAVVLKDGHGVGDQVCDWLLTPDFAPQALRRPRVRTHGGQATVRGTGCRFGSHLAAGLGLGLALPEAALRAGHWVAEEISKAP
ncbi:MAG: bifunctional hydroxymethylpyrimidine kinase/phosphomethylpyrimidine kinase [Planctomycetes bacterium]|nr:bifunctional hydroxymethylpyrimidine kinase/phosphomethylpyrimidine kinase [Planctomycetota bacterium]